MFTLIVLSMLQAVALQGVDDSARAADVAPAAETAPLSVDARTRPLRIAVYTLENTGVDVRVARLVDRFLLVELRKLAAVNVIGMEEIQQMLDHEAAKQLMGCSADESCLAEIAGSLGVDEIITGNLARVGDEHIIGLRRIDQHQAAVTGNVSRRLVAESGEEFLAAIGPAIAELYPDRVLRAGVSRGVAPEVALALDPPPLDPWMPLTALVGAGAFAALGAGTFGLYALATLLHTSMLAEAEVTEQPWSTIAGVRNASNVFAVSTWVLVAGAAVLGGTGGILALFTDWKGYRDAIEERPAE
jgi:hypothetical protein